MADLAGAILAVAIAVSEVDQTAPVENRIYEEAGQIKVCKIRAGSNVMLCFAADTSKPEICAQEAGFVGCKAATRGILKTENEQ